MKPRGTLTLSCHLSVKYDAITDVFTFELKSSVGLACVASTCVHVCVHGFRGIQQDPFQATSCGAREWSLLPPRPCGWRNDAKVMQVRSQLCQEVAIWERSANPPTLPGAGMERGAGGASGQCQQCWKSGLFGCLADWLSHRCANASSPQHLCPL